MQVPYTYTDTNLSLVVNNKMHTINSGDICFHDVKEYLKDNVHHDPEELQNLLDKDTKLQCISSGNVTVVNDRVFYFGAEVHNSLTIKLLDIMSDGHDATPWVRFLNNLMDNPDYNSRENLYRLLEKHSAPITSDGSFIAFKRVRYDYKDIHSGTFDNSPGRVVKMDRRLVDGDPDRTCSRGLHACASEYLGNFYANCSNSRVVMVKVNPKNVAAVPADYSFSKMRVSEYEVLATVQEKHIKAIEAKPYFDDDWELADFFDDDWGL